MLMRASVVTSPPRFVEPKVSATGRMGTFIEEAVPIVRGSPLIVPLTVYKMPETDLLPSCHVPMALLLGIFAAFPQREGIMAVAIESFGYGNLEPPMVLECLSPQLAHNPLVSVRVRPPHRCPPLQHQHL